jgi:hypothetical protein
MSGMHRSQHLIFDLLMLQIFNLIIYSTWCLDYHLILSMLFLQSINCYDILLLGLHEEDCLTYCGCGREFEDKKLLINLFFRHL